MLLAGHETTAAAIAWTLGLLVSHQEAYERVQHEIDSVFGQRRVTADDIKRLSLTLAALKEALRLYPPAYIIVREALHTLTIDRYTIPQGAVVVINTVALKRDEAHYPAPERFVLNRFASDVERRLPRGSYCRLTMGRTYASATTSR